MRPTKEDLVVGMLVEVRVDKTTDTARGVIAKIQGHSEKKGVKVLLRDGKVGYVDRIVPKHEYEKEAARFYISLVQMKHLYYLAEDRGLWIWPRKGAKGIERTCFLFSSEHEAKQFLAKQKMERPVRRFSTAKTIAAFLEKDSPDVIYVDGSKRLKLSVLTEQEAYYRMRMG